jgi:hypothetical protein
VKFAPTKGSRVRSKHFSLDMIEEGGERVILKPDAFPTIFPNSGVCPNFFHLFALLTSYCSLMS